MRKRKRNSFARIGALCVALVMALGAMGTAYGGWSETLNISGIIETGEVLFGLTATDNYTEPSGGSVTCEVVDDALEVTVINADTAYHYSGNFTIENTGDIPLKMLVDESTVPSEVVAEIINVVGDGTVDPGETEEGRVHIYLIDSTHQGVTFTVITNAVIWNQ